MGVQGCPACNAATDAEAASLAWFLRENYRQAETLTALAHRRFCREHLRRLLGSRDPHLAATLEHLTRRQAEALERFRERALRRRLLPSPRRRLPGEAQPVDEPERCQFCAGGRRAATVAITDVIDLLRSERWRVAYRASDGLCCPHAWTALREAPAEVADWLAGDTHRRLREAEAEIDEWYRSLRRGARMSSGAAAWADAAHLVWGNAAGP